MKASLRHLLVVPAALLLGLGGTALVSVPASAAPVASPTPTQSPTPTPTQSPSPTPTQSPNPTRPPSPKRATSSDLVLTSPRPDEDGSVRVQGPRTLTLEGTAPVGTRLSVTDSDGAVIARTTTTTSSFSIPLTFAADAGYEQFLSLFGTSAGRVLTEIDLDVTFDAETSETPTILAPSTGSTYRVAPAPFAGGQPNAIIEFSGTGTPGDTIDLYSSRDDEDFDGGPTDAIVVGADGTWTGDYSVVFGSVSVTAAAARYTDDGDQTTIESAESSPVDLTVSPPVGAILPPRITSPNYDGLDFSASIDPGTDTVYVNTYSSESQSQSQSASASRVAPRGADRPRTQSAKIAARSIATTDWAARPAVGVVQRKLSSVVALAKLSEGRARAADDFPETLDGVIDEYGIPVTGRTSATTTGAVDMTVSGTGTPGDDIVLYEERGDDALTYLSGLYPALFASSGDPAPLQPESARRVVPAAVSTGDPAATSSLPVDDGTVRVGSDGQWSATLTREPGDYLLTAFAARSGGTRTADFSVATDVSLIHLTGTPRAAAGVTPTSGVAELAFTGSTTWPTLAVGLGGLAAGGVLLVVARRRRPRPATDAA